MTKKQPEEGTSNGAETEVTAAVKTPAMIEYNVYKVTTANGGTAYPQGLILIFAGIFAKTPADAIKAKHTGAGDYVVIATKYVKALTVKVETVEQVSVG